ncbi:hypothetical protein [Halalkalibacter krulwichiae]|uniref:Uncharacterized protein n=1 Tax=Halalkalibacter krulwichiae TaxID=199441 RepID=A0A1X9MH29_9BACI|nr:hypothetical protein [Halalkalibacter krulwichiae]ARK32765.1 hypothetical protein BkAM31D_24500 [Halalkalibacter krulwichiae]
MDEKQLIKDTKLCTRWAIGLSLVLVVIWPGIMFTTGYVYSEQFLTGWFYLSFAWLVVAALFIVTRPLIEFYKDAKEKQ